MAAPATGHRQTDHIRVMALCEAALDLSVRVLTPGGAFVAKVLRGGTENDLLNAMKRNFRTVRHVKPPASRSDSAESYVIAILVDAIIGAAGMGHHAPKSHGRRALEDFRDVEDAMVVGIKSGAASAGIDLTGDA